VRETSKRVGREVDVRRGHRRAIISWADSHNVVYSAIEHTHLGTYGSAMSRQNNHVSELSRVLRLVAWRGGAENAAPDRDHRADITILSLRPPGVARTEKHIKDQMSWVDITTLYIKEPYRRLDISVHLDSTSRDAYP